MENAFPPALPHGELEQVFPDTFFVTGTMQMKPFFRFSRNMIVLRQDGALTLVNSVRLTEPGLERLDALGKVENVIKLGFFHDRDDAFYVDRYQARLWALPGHTHAPGLAADVEMKADTELPIRDASLFLFETTAQPEAILRLDREGGILITCDSLQNWARPGPEFNLVSRLMMRAMGFFKPCNVGPGWIRMVKPGAEDFARLQALSYEHVLGAHGTPVKGGARDRYAPALQRLFGLAPG